MIKFFCPGRPQAQGSKTKGRFGNIREDNVELGPWRERVALAAYEARLVPLGPIERDSMEGIYEVLMDGPITLDLEFVLYRPKSAPKTKEPPATKKPDVDKMARAVMDALTGVIYRDDAQVVELCVHKRIAAPNEQMGVHVIVRSFP